MKDNQNRTDEIRQVQTKALGADLIAPVPADQVLNKEKTLSGLRRIRGLLTLRNLIAVALALLAVLAAGVVFLCHLSRAYVIGNEWYTNAEIEQYVQDTRFTDNTFMMAVLFHGQKLGDIAFVDSIDVDLVNPVTVRINVHEKQVSGCIKKAGQYWYFSQDGTLQEISDGILSGVPTLSGLTLKKGEGSEKLVASNETAWGNVLTACQMMAKYEVTADAISAGSHGSVTFTRGKVKISLGANASTYESKISHIRQIGTRLDGLSGTIDLASWDGTGSDIILSPDK